MKLKEKYSKQISVNVMIPWYMVRCSSGKHHSNYNSYLSEENTNSCDKQLKRIQPMLTYINIKIP